MFLCRLQVRLLAELGNLRIRLKEFILIFGVDHHVVHLVRYLNVDVIESYD